MATGITHGWGVAIDILKDNNGYKLNTKTDQFYAGNAASLSYGANNPTTPKVLHWLEKRNTAPHST